MTLIRNQSSSVSPVMVFGFINVLPIRPPIQAIGIYAKAISATVNQMGPGSMMFIAIPPSRNRPPMAKANFILWETAIKAAIIAPASVPKACAKKGKTKNSAVSVGHDFDKRVKVLWIDPFNWENRMSNIDKAHVDDAASEPTNGNCKDV